VNAPRRERTAAARPSRRRRGLAALLLLAAAVAWAAACAGPKPPPVTAGPSPPAAPPAGGEVPVAAEPVEPEPVPDVVAPEPGAAARAPRPRGPVILRVGLESDLARVDLPCCDAGRRLEAAGQRLDLDRPTAVEPAVAPGSGEVLRLQVAALRDEAGAAELAAQLARRWGWPADAHFDAGVGLYRVRAGRFRQRGEAEAARGRLQAAGTSGVWIVAEGELAEPALRVVRDGRAARLAGRWLRLAGGERGVEWNGRRYRGDLLVFLNPRGTLNVINEVPLEDYLRGVVPAEMGPIQYDRLESLKAQAVAARTYTLRSLAGFRDEGYDLCATPRCQVYAGRGAEHPLSDRAVAETAGEVLVHGGELVDARYSATCGGHTEDVAVVFPQEDRHDYLRGVPCIEAGGTVLAGAGLEGAPFPADLVRRLLPPPAGLPPAAALDARLAALAATAGLPAARRGGNGALASTARRDVRRQVSHLFDLALGPRVLLAAEDLPRFVAAPPAAWSREERRQAALLVDSGLWSGAPEAPVEGLEAERLLFQLARLAGVVEARPMLFRAVEAPADGGRYLRAQPRGEGGERRLALPDDLATYRRGGGELVATDLSLAAGDPLTVWTAGGRPLAVVQEVDPSRTVADPPHARSAWSRFRADGELARRVEERYPGLGFQGLEVVSRGVSGRAAAVRLLGRGGRSVVVEGLPVRWTLDVPDTRFTVQRVRGGWSFRGTGWGHGVGMCQAGSFAMAGRGVGYRDILRHYYTGTGLARVRSRAPWWTAAAETAVAAAR
jgi:peptidoglycan hydrolase-like amidase